MKSEKAESIIRTGEWMDDETGVRAIYIQHAIEAVEVAEQEAEERMRTKAIETFKSECVFRDLRCKPECKECGNEVDRSTVKGSLRVGLSRKEEFVKAAMQGLCASVGASQGAGFIGAWSVSIADATIAELDKP